MAIVTGRGLSAEWRTIEDLAIQLGVSRQYFANSLRTLVSDDAVRRVKANGPVELHAPTFWVAWADYKIATAAKASRSDPADPLLAGEGDGSLQLERYRAAKADLAELDVAKRRGEVAEVSRLESYLRVAMGVIRGAIERVQREYGVGAYDIMAEAVGEAERRVERLAEEYGQVSDDSDDDGANGAGVGPVDTPGEAADDS